MPVLKWESTDFTAKIKRPAALEDHTKIYTSAQEESRLFSGIILPWLLLLFWTISDSIWASEIRFDRVQGLDIGFCWHKKKPSNIDVSNTKHKIVPALYTSWDIQHFLRHCRVTVELWSQELRLTTDSVSMRGFKFINVFIFFIAWLKKPQNEHSVRKA